MTERIEPTWVKCDLCRCDYLRRTTRQKYCSVSCKKRFARVLEKQRPKPTGRITVKCASCGNEFEKAASSKVLTCGVVCSMQLKRTNRRTYNRNRVRALWKDIKDNRPKRDSVRNDVTLGRIPDPNRYMERDTPKRRSERAKRAALKMEISSLGLYGQATYLTDDERRKHQQEIETQIGKPRVWWGVKERRLQR